MNTKVTPESFNNRVETRTNTDEYINRMNNNAQEGERILFDSWISGVLRFSFLMFLLGIIISGVVYFSVIASKAVPSVYPHATRDSIDG